jgi:hypothetical protein
MATRHEDQAVTSHAAGDITQRWLHLVDVDHAAEAHITVSPEGVQAFVHIYRARPQQRTGNGAPLDGFGDAITIPARDMYEAWLVAGRDDEVLWARLQAALDGVTARAAAAKAAADSLPGLTDKQRKAVAKAIIDEAG